MAHYYPPKAFHFKVEVLGLPANDNDVRFAEAGGLSVQKYPTRAKYPELVLKRGLLVGSAVFDWIRQSIQELRIEPKNVDVKLLNDEHQPLMTWHLVNAYPTKWSVADLNASANSVAVETLQLYYQYFTVDATAVPRA